MVCWSRDWSPHMSLPKDSIQRESADEHYETRANQLKVKYLRGRHLVSNRVYGNFQKIEGGDSPHMIIEALVTHNPAAIPLTTLLLCQMAKLEGSMSTFFEKRIAARKCRRLTCEAGSIVSPCRGLERKKSRDKKK